MAICDGGGEIAVLILSHSSISLHASAFFFQIIIFVVLGHFDLMYMFIYDEVNNFRVTKPIHRLRQNQ